jgi:TonB family protein
MKPCILLLALFLVLPCRCLTQQNPVLDSKQSQVPEANKNGYSYPECLYCPRAQYTRQALDHNFQGTMTLLLIVTPQGRAKDIQVLKPLPYGLTESGIEAVRKWRFKPATGPDGKPAAVRQRVWVTFHIRKQISNPTGERLGTKL